jgi:carbon storage regulator
MLVLSRKIMESIKVGDVTFTIVRIGKGTVRIGIDAPREVKIVRTEIIQREPDQCSTI